MFTMSIASGRKSLFSGVRRGRQLAAFVGTQDVHRSFVGIARKGTAVRSGFTTEPLAHRSPSIATQLFSSVATSNSENNLLGEEYAGTTLPIQKNSHNSVKIVVPTESEDTTINDLYDPTTFHTKLEATITAAQQLGKTAIWITIPICSARLIEEASKLDFEFHHAEGTTATLNKWIKEDEESRIPTYATHQVGVGAVVINSNDEILVVREKRRNYRPWKVPGGLAELGEDLDEAVEREVLEETGIQTKFQSVLGVRHVHGVQFNRSDLFFVCRLEPIPDESGSIPCPVAQEGEIEAVSWQPLSEYRDMVFSEEHGHPMMQQIMKVVDQGLEQDWEETDIQRLIVGSVVPGRKPSPVYHAPIRAVDSDESP